MLRGSFCVLALVAAAQATTPVQKVTELLVKLRDQIQTEGEAEAAAYDKFSCFCKEQSDEKVYMIGRSKAKVDELEAAVESLGAEISQLDEEATARKEDVSAEREQAKSALGVRDEARGVFEGNRANLTEGIEAITNAIAALKASRSQVQETGAAALIKVRDALSKVQVRGLELKGLSLLDATPKGGKPNAYEYKSADIIATLEELLRTFKAELTELDEAESLENHDFNMVEGARANKVRAYEAEIAKKQKLSAEKSAEKSKKEALLAEETAAMNADQAFLDELTTTCEAKATAWDERSKTRAAEVTTITEALKKLEEASGLYSVNKKLVGLVASGTSASSSVSSSVRQPSLVQLRAARRHMRGNALQNLTGFLGRRAQALGSSRLAALASRVAASNVGAAPGDDHFAGVRSLIKDLIAKLEADKDAEATQKTFCDEEMGKAVQDRDEKKAELETLAANIDMTNSSINELASSIAELEEEIAKLYKALNEITELRAEEKKANEKAVVDADAGATAVKEAIAVLKQFYADEGAAFQQMQAVRRYTPPNADRNGSTVSDVAPDVFSGDYRGKTDASKGIIGLLDVIASDFERTSQKTAEAEKQLEADFQEQSTTINGEIDSKKEEKKAKEDDKSTKEADLVGFQDSAKDAESLHSQAIERLRELKASCVDSDESWEERKAQREKEIEALKQALQILEDWKN